MTDSVAARNLKQHLLPGLIALVFLGALLSACAESPDALEQIEQNVAAMEAALADRDNADFREHLADNFIGGGKGQRKLYKEDVQKLLAGYFYRYKDIKILVTQLQVAVDDYQPALASTTATVVLSGGKRAIPDSAGIYQVSGQWQDFDGTWKLTELEWE